MAPRQRFKRDRPCLICGGHADASRTLPVEDWLSSCCFRPRGPASSGEPIVSKPRQARWARGVEGGPHLSRRGQEPGH